MILLKEYVFNEEKYIHDIMQTGSVDKNRIGTTIKHLARYNHYVLGLNKNENYTAIDLYMRKHSNVYTEVSYCNTIISCISKVKKYAWKNIDKIVITKEELNRIQELNDVKKEKLAFVLLADAKYANAYKENKTNLSNLSNAELFKRARVSMSASERDLFLHFLCSEGLVEVQNNVSNTANKLLYVSESDTEEDGIVLKEYDYKELSYVYLNWKHQGGYKPCEKCGRMFKISSNRQIYCLQCQKYDPIGTKKVACSDCGVEFEVDAESRTKRCENCYIYERKRIYHENYINRKKK